MFKKDEKTDITPIITGVAGIVAGAAAATLLSNEENRKKMGKHLQNIKKRTIDTIKEISKDAGETADEIAERGKEKMQEQVEKTKTTARKYLS